jgi:hypothetical protein
MVPCLFLPWGQDLTVTTEGIPHPGSPQCPVLCLIGYHQSRSGTAANQALVGTQAAEEAPEAPLLSHSEPLV